MAFEPVTVKLEPSDLTEDTENGSTLPSPSPQDESELVNVKMEIEVPGTHISIKSEPIEATSSPSRPTSWHTPVAGETGLQPDSIQVTIKQEVEDNDDNHESDDSCTEETRSLKHTSTSRDNIEQTEGTSSGREYVCKICKKTFANPGNVQRHLLIHTRQTIQCEHCNGQFLNKMRLDRHIFNKHTLPTERVFPCDVCQKTFKSSSNLMQHKKTHLAEKPYKCPTCHKTFSFKTNLIKHQGKKDRCKMLDIEPLVCNVCNKVFQKKYSLKSHLRKHDTERPFACDQCETTFKYKSTLIRHIQLHNGIKPFSCPVCDKTFTHSGLLKPHMRTHTGERPYQCQICLKKFTHKHNMQRHMLRHDKIKHLVCDICHKKFPRESRLKYHMKTHVNEKYFACHVCPKRFSHKQNVLRHYSRKHPGQTYNGTDTDASVALKVWDTIKSKYYDDEAEVILG